MDEQDVVDSIICIVRTGTHSTEHHQYEAAKRMLFDAQCAHRFPGEPEDYEAAMKSFAAAFGI